MEFDLNFIELSQQQVSTSFMRSEDIKIIINTEAGRKDKLSDIDIYNMIKNINNIILIFPPEIIKDKDKYDEVLDKLFTLIIKHGSHDFKMNMKYEDTLIASNYLKKDKNYIEILDMNWDSISEGIETIFSEI